MILHTARFGDLDGPTLYALLRLRVDVFVVEQQCPYPELDGRDLSPSTVHVWLTDGGPPAAAASTNARHDSGLNTRTGPLRSFESRTPTTSGVTATSTHAPLLFPLRVLLRQTARDSSVIRSPL